jgi:hypothetical protein
MYCFILSLTSDLTACSADSCVSLLENLMILKCQLKIGNSTCLTCDLMICRSGRERYVNLSGTRICGGLLSVFMQGSQVIANMRPVHKRQFTAFRRSRFETNLLISYVSKTFLFDTQPCYLLFPGYDGCPLVAKLISKSKFQNLTNAISFDTNGTP